VGAFLNRRGADELEQKFSRRLDRMSNQLARVERDGHITMETLALFIRHMLTVNAPLPEGDATAQAIGRDRFTQFIQLVARRLASGKRTFATEQAQDEA
jgi:hypothetical protein